MDNLSTIFLVLTFLNFFPFLVWLLVITAIPDRGYGGSNKPLRIRTSFDQLFTGPIDAMNWAVITSMVFTAVCFIFYILVSLLPIVKSSDITLSLI